MGNRFWSVFHNLIAHPLMVFLPSVWGDALHDWSGAKAFGSTEKGGAEHG